MRKKNAGSTPAGSAPVSFRTSVASSMITMLLQSAYSVVDGLFVSNLVGDTALAAVNVACPSSLSSLPPEPESAQAEPPI